MKFESEPQYKRGYIKWVDEDGTRHKVTPEEYRTIDGMPHVEIPEEEEVLVEETPSEGSPADLMFKDEIMESETQKEDVSLKDKTVNPERRLWNDSKQS